jgi:glycosyltransferase involved in cell wall biosynthesis
MRLQTRQHLGFGDDDLVVVFVARLAPMKNHRMLIDCLAGMVPEHDKLRLVLVGQGPLEAELKEQVSLLDLDERVTFAGQQDDVRPYYWAADIAVQPSVREGQSQVLSEAMAAGLPCVCSDAGGMKEVVVNGETGYVVPAGKPEPFSAAIRQLAGNATLRQLFGEAGKMRAREHFDVSVMIRRHLEFYEQVITDSGVSLG